MENLVPKKIANTIINALKGGVVPRIGLEYITVGRTGELMLFYMILISLLMVVQPFYLLLENMVAVKAFFSKQYVIVQQ